MFVCSSAGIKASPAAAVRWAERRAGGGGGQRPQPEQVSHAAQLPSLKLCHGNLPKLHNILFSCYAGLKFNFIFSGVKRHMYATCH